MGVTAAQRRVVSALRAHARTMESWVRLTRKTSKLRPQVANTFLLNVMLDRSVTADRAWEASEWIADALGDEEDPAVLWRTLQSLERKRLLGFMRYGFGGKAFHRHYRTFTRTLPLAAEHILEHYDGDPRRIWNGQRDIDAVRAKLDAIPNIGRGLANMALLTLVRKFGLLGRKKARRHLDPKPDIHVRRVFQRTRLVEGRRVSDADIIAAARRLAPDFPASLDAPAWDIGRQWCRPARPKCSDCPVNAACPARKAD